MNIAPAARMRFPDMCSVFAAMQQHQSGRALELFSMAHVSALRHFAFERRCWRLCWRNAWKVREGKWPTSLDFAAEFVNLCAVGLPCYPCEWYD